MLLFPHRALFLLMQERPRGFAMVAGLPAGLFGFLVLRIAWEHARAVIGPGLGAWAAALLATALGVTGVATLPSVGHSAGDMVVAVPLATAYWLVLREARRRDAGGAAGPAAVAAAGFAAGMAAGLKLTTVPFAAAIGLMILALLGFRAAVAAGAAMLAGLLVMAGPHAWYLWEMTGNPVFPHYNALFRAPDWLPLSQKDERFLPRSTLQAVFYPFYWLRPTSGLVSELGMRDPRIAMGYVAWAAIAVLALARARAFAGGWRANLLPLGVAAVSYAAWVLQFGIYRYLLFLEALAAVLVMLALLLAWRARPMLALGALLALTVGAIQFTIQPGQARAPHGARILLVEPTPVRAGDLVVIVSSDPVGYLALLFPPDVPVLGVSNNLVQPGQEHGLNRRARALLDGHRGRIWAVSNAPGDSASRERVLSAYGLVPDGACVRLRSNLEPDSHLFCSVRKGP